MATKIVRPPAGSLKPVQLLQVRDFTGGINLRDDAFQVKINELCDCLNVDVLPTGGVQRRKTVQPFNAAALPSAPRNVWTYLDVAAPQVLVQVGVAGHVAWATSSGVFTTLSTAPWSSAVTGLMRATTMARLTGATANVGHNYIARNAEQTSVVWDGTTGSALTDAYGAYNDDISSPAGGKFPKCRYVKSHLGRMFAAWTVENSINFKNRLRFSHPGEPEDWRTLDYIDIDPGVKGDEITGLAEWGDQLLIFKRRSVHILSGYSPETFQVTPLTLEVGAVSQEAIASSEQGIAWFDADRGVFLYSGSAISWLWEKLVAKITDNTIQTAFRSVVTCGWLAGRLYCNVPWESGATTNTRAFVYDPVVQAWTVHQYDGQFGLGPMASFKPNNALTLSLGCSPSTNFVFSVESGSALDNVGGTDEGFDSYFVTAWFDAGAPGVLKRWRRPTFIADDDVLTKYTVSVWRDYKVQSVDRTFPLQFGTSPFAQPVLDTLYDDTTETYDGDALYDGSGTAAIPVGFLVWGTGVWGQLWGEASVGGQGIAKGSAFGTALAVRLQINGPTDLAWNMNSMQFRFIMGRIR